LDDSTQELIQEDSLYQFENQISNLDVSPEDVIGMIQKHSQTQKCSSLHSSISQNISLIGINYVKQQIEQRVSSQSFNKSEILFLFDILKALSKVEVNAIVDNFHQTVRSLLCWNICRKMVGRENKEEAVSEFEY